jgi:lipopolysaccharide export system permease protein
MLNSLDKYIVKKFVKFFAITFMIVVGIIWLTRIIKYIEFITVRNMGIGDFFSITLLILPKLADFLLPIIVFVTAIVTINNLIQTKELHIFKASGLSSIQILKPFLFVVVIVMGSNYMLNSYISPYSHNKTEKIKLELANEFVLSLIAASELTNINEFSVYIGEKNSANSYEDIVILNKISATEDMVLTADEVKFAKFKGQILLNLLDGNRLVTENNKVVSSLFFDNYLTNFDFFNEGNDFSDNVKMKISQLYLHELLNGKVSFPRHEVLVELAQRILWPMLSFIFVCFAVLILSEGQYMRNGNFLSNFITIVIGVLIIAIFFTLKTLSSQRIELVFVTYGYIMFVAVLGLVLNIIKLKKIPGNGKEELSTN